MKQSQKTPWQAQTNHPDPRLKVPNNLANISKIKNILVILFNKYFLKTGGNHDAYVRKVTLFFQNFIFKIQNVKNLEKTLHFFQKKQNFSSRMLDMTSILFSDILQSICSILYFLRKDLVKKK